VSSSDLALDANYRGNRYNIEQRGPFPHQILRPHILCLQKSPLPLEAGRSRGTVPFFNYLADGGLKNLRLQLKMEHVFPFFRIKEELDNLIAKK
jgi:hypothetical protein